jgi:hypothetical protein
MTKDELKVGQQVWVHDINHRRQGATRGQIIKIGTKLVTIANVWDNGRLGRESQYRIDTQHWNDKDFGSHHWFRTDEQEVLDKHVKEIDNYLYGVGIRFDTWGRKIDFPDRERIAELLKERGYESKGRS